MTAPDLDGHLDSSLDGYLARLGLTERPPVTIDGLREVHRAHVARISYDNLADRLDAVMATILEGNT